VLGNIDFSNIQYVMGKFIHDMNICHDIQYKPITVIKFFLKIELRTIVNVAVYLVSIFLMYNCKFNSIVVNEGIRWMESRDKVMAFYGFSLHSNHSKLSDIMHYWQAVSEVPVHYTQFQQSHVFWMAPIIHLWFSQGQ